MKSLFGKSTSFFFLFYGVALLPNELQSLWYFVLLIELVSDYRSFLFLVSFFSSIWVFAYLQ